MTYVPPPPPVIYPKKVDIVEEKRTEVVPKEVPKEDPDKKAESEKEAKIKGKESKKSKKMEKKAGEPIRETSEDRKMSARNRDVKTDTKQKSTEAAEEMVILNADGCEKMDKTLEELNPAVHAGAIESAEKKLVADPKRVVYKGFLDNDSSNSDAEMKQIQKELDAECQKQQTRLHNRHGRAMAIVRNQKASKSMETMETTVSKEELPGGTKVAFVDSANVLYETREVETDEELDNNELDRPLK